MANNDKDEVSGSAVNTSTNVPTSNQAQFATLELRRTMAQLIDKFDRMERKENNDGREGHVNENPRRFRRGCRVERDLLQDDEEHLRPGRRPHSRMRVGGRQRDRPKVDLSRFSGGDPNEWLDKVDYYCWVYEVAGTIGLPPHACT
ncbi:hypothetical protein ACOSQ4_005515 [Xanthoceras sorbifolium]